MKCITECEEDEDVKVIYVDAGCKAKTRLANLGIIPGVKIIKRRSAPFKGPVEINVKGSNLVIGRGLAMKVYVDVNKEN
ncbi:MAG: FeoA family protein [Candidatus Lokiarchaeota archaeon]